MKNFLLRLLSKGKSELCLKSALTGVPAQIGLIAEPDMVLLDCFITEDGIGIFGLTCIQIDGTGRLERFLPWGEINQVYLNQLLYLTTNRISYTNLDTQQTDLVPDHYNDD